MQTSSIDNGSFIFDILSLFLFMSDLIPEDSFFLICLKVNLSKKFAKLKSNKGFPL